MAITTQLTFSSTRATRRPDLAASQPPNSAPSASAWRRPPSKVAFICPRKQGAEHSKKARFVLPLARRLGAAKSASRRRITYLFSATAPVSGGSGREYFRANDGHLYFRAAEAGKSLTYTPASGTAQSVEIKPDVQFTSTLPSNVPADFINTPYTSPDNPSDPHIGKFYYSVSRDTVPANIMDVGRDGAGVFVRTLWLDSGRYAQEATQ